MASSRAVVNEAGCILLPFRAVLFRQHSPAASVDCESGLCVLVLPSATLLDSQHDASVIIPELAKAEVGELGSVAVEELSHSVEQCRPLVTIENRGPRPVCVQYDQVSAPHEATRRFSIQLIAPHAPCSAGTGVGPRLIVNAARPFQWTAVR
jgi:hypothetical protein